MPLLCIFGKPQTTEGIVLGAAGRETNLELAATQWAPPAEPLSLRAGEGLYRLSRHSLQDQVWTWLGCYAHADAIGSTRDGGFYGAALLSRDERIDGERGLAFLSSIMPTLAQSLLKDGRFIRDVRSLNPQLDQDQLQNCVAGPAVPSRGLGADAFGKLFVGLPDGDSRTLARLIDFGQQDPRCRGESAIYASAVPRLTAASAQSLQTAGIAITSLDELEARPEPSPPADMPPAPMRPAAPAPRRQLGAAALEAQPGSLHNAIMDDVRRLIDQRLHEFGELQSRQRAAGKAGQGWRTFALSFAGTAALALLFIIAVFLALPYAGRLPETGSAAPALAAPATIMPETRQRVEIGPNPVDEAQDDSAPGMEP